MNVVLVLIDWNQQGEAQEKSNYIESWYVSQSMFTTDGSTADCG